MIDWTNPSADILEAKRVGREEGLVDQRCRAEAMEESRVAMKAFSDAREVVRVMGNAAADVIDQMLKGKWKDDHDHDVRKNTAMVALAESLKLAATLPEGVNWKAVVAAMRA